MYQGAIQTLAGVPLEPYQLNASCGKERTSQQRVFNSPPQIPVRLDSHLGINGCVLLEADGVQMGLSQEGKKSPDGTQPPFLSLISNCESNELNKGSIFSAPPLPPFILVYSIYPSLKCFMQAVPPPCLRHLLYAE